MNVLIIDDEENAREVLRIILKEYCPQIQNIYEAENLKSGIKVIKKAIPQIVFLDIEMPEYSGLQILDFLNKDDFNFEIIFTTAYSKYAINAFEVSAIDYLLKPLRPFKVQKAVQKFEILKNKNQVYQKLTELSKSLNSNLSDKIALPINDGIDFIELDDIICLEADRMYTLVHSLSKDIILVSKPLKHFEKNLKRHPNFYRTHRSFIINVKHVKRLIKKDGVYIIMQKNISVSLSKEKKDEFFSFFN